MMFRLEVRLEKIQALSETDLLILAGLVSGELMARHQHLIAEMMEAIMEIVEEEEQQEEEGIRTRADLTQALMQAIVKMNCPN